MEDAVNQSADGRWYLMLHQVPPAPAYFRARVLRQLNQLGALPIKKSAYLLPANDETLEDLQWLRRSIVADGGEAWIFRAESVAGHSDADLERQFRELHAGEYTELAAGARVLLDELRSGPDRKDETGAQDEQSFDTRLRKLKRRFAAVSKIDYFIAPQQAEVAALMNEIETSRELGAQPETPVRGEFRGRRWVTRRGIKVDRMASAWLIRRFIDPSPEFVFVDPAAYTHLAADLRFDMFEGEITHEGPLCTFEVLCERMKLEEPGLRALADIVHDIDLKESTHRRSETAGVAMVIDGIVARHADDESRLRAGVELFDALYAKLRS